MCDSENNKRKLDKTRYHLSVRQISSRGRLLYQNNIVSTIEEEICAISIATYFLLSERKYVYYLQEGIRLITVELDNI